MLLSALLVLPLAGLLFRVPARLAAFRRGEGLLGIESLITLGKLELSLAIHAGDGLVGHLILY
jgi:hypothetical protein